MNEPDNSAPRGPRTRRDSTAPAGPRPRAREADRRPYPTAPTPTKPGLARPGTARASARARRPVSAPIPATVWVSGARPVDPAAMWPPSIVATIVSSFTEPGARVALLPWPAPIQPGSTAEHGDDADGGGVDEALAVIEELERNAHVLWIYPSLGAAVVQSPRPRPGQVRPAPSHEDENPSTGAASEPLDLVITSVAPHRVAEGGGEPGVGRVIDEVALVAARTLRVGGIFVALTHCDWSSGVLLDPSGPIVASGQSADLLYLQHIVALHRPVRGGRFTPDAGSPDDAVEQAPDRDPAVEQRFPGTHRRIHSDVYAFAQPHDHDPPLYLRAAPPSPDGAAQDAGVLR